MTYRYETPTTRRLSLGSSDAPYRLCLPVSAETFTAVAQLDRQAQREYLTVAGLMLEAALESMTAPHEEPAEAPPALARMEPNYEPDTLGRSEHATEDVAGDLGPL